VNTPLGWARANFIYEKEDRPVPGSLVEVIFIIVFFMKQRIQFQRTRVDVQAALDQEGKETLRAFEDFRKAVFPYERRMALQKFAEEKKVLEKWVTDGPVSVTPMFLPRKGRQYDKGIESLKQRKLQEQAGLLERV